MFLLFLARKVLIMRRLKDKAEKSLKKFGKYFYKTLYLSSKYENNDRH